MSRDDLSTWLVLAALALAAISLPIAVVALSRSAHTSTMSSSNGMGSMDMGSMDMSGSAMAAPMAAVPSANVPNATVNEGGTRLAPTMVNGVATFNLVARPVRWQILPGVRVTAWTFNGMVPGPELHLAYGQKVRVIVKNELPEPTTVHWHGIDVPNSMDGVPGITQKPIAPGKTFTYAFRALPAGGGSQGGTFFYHSHYDEDRQVGLGLSGALIIDPPKPTEYAVDRTMMIQEWSFAQGQTRPAMDMTGMQPNYFTLNGKSYPATQTIHVRRGQSVLLRLVGAGQYTHPMHLHGTDFRIVAVDGHPVSGPPARQDTVLIGSGQRDDLVFSFDRPGKWIFHCHIGHHLTNDGSAPGGLMMVFDVT